MKRRIVVISISLVIFLALVYLLGPSPIYQVPVSSEMKIEGLSIQNVETYLAEKEKGFPIKPDLQSQVVWADSTKSQTEFVVVYLSGFGAAWPEAEPVHRNFAKHFGYNLYLPRFYEHGLNVPGDSVFDDLTPEKMVLSANEALAVGRLLGKKMILMATSTGATLAIYLAEQNDIASFILLSPNLGIDHRLGTDFLDGPWGKAIARFSIGSTVYKWKPRNTKEDELWSTSYRIEGLMAMRRLIRFIDRPEVLKNIEQPVFLAYYPKDRVISVASIERLYPNFPNAVVKTFPQANHHVIGSVYLSDSYQEVQKEVIDFWENQLRLDPSK
jgi:pimeloyl-ACP methyl ester carboxylesterase